MSEKMQIEMLSTQKGSEDGINSSVYEAGETYIVGEELGNAFVNAKMAKKKQVDSAALSYMHVTMTCINCHKYVKNAKVARGEPLSPGLKLALQRDKLLRR